MGSNFWVLQKEVPLRSTPREIMRRFTLAQVINSAKAASSIVIRYLLNIGVGLEVQNLVN